MDVFPLTRLPWQTTHKPPRCIVYTYMICKIVILYIIHFWSSCWISFAFQHFRIIFVEFCHNTFCWRNSTQKDLELPRISRLSVMVICLWPGQTDKNLWWTFYLMQNTGDTKSTNVNIDGYFLGFIENSVMTS